MTDEERIPMPQDSRADPVRLHARKSAPLSGDRGESSLDSVAERRGHARIVRLLVERVVYRPTAPTSPCALPGWARWSATCR
jgi:hypothetical protein